jgi:hypothetical protein
MQHQSIEEQIANKCRHFNGIQHGTCEAGIVYNDVRDASTRHLPCFKDDGCSQNCQSVSFLSEQEVAEEAAREKAIAAAFLEEMVAGITCPHCHVTIEEKTQVGRCVYAKPCGHRLYQGKLSKQEGDAQP